MLRSVVLRCTAKRLVTGRPVKRLLPQARMFSGFLSEKDFLNSSALAAAGPSTTTTTTTTTTAVSTVYTPTPAPVYQAIKLGVQLAKFGINLTKMAADGELEKVIGREDEIQQAIQILSRRKKNNPCLIGEPGVGKTAIAEGLATLIVEGNVPDSMLGKSIISLDMPALLAGTKFRGEFEERLKGVMKEVEQANDKIILFIDELHVMVGAGGSDGAIDASNILKPSLARGKLRCLGATTTDEYAKHIEKDPALARRFQSVYIPEPSAEHTVQILQGLRDKYETHHRVLLPDAAIEVAVHLTGRYLTSKKFPDKAIDLIDESMSRIRNRRERKPAELLSIEKQLNALLCETDGAGDHQAQVVGDAAATTDSNGKRRENPVVAECIEFCNKVVGAGDSSNSSGSSGATGATIVPCKRDAASVNEQIRVLSAKRDALHAEWASKNASVNALFESRSTLAQCQDQYRTQRKNNVVDSDNFLQKRIEQKENELRELCDTLVKIGSTSASGVDTLKSDTPKTAHKTIDAVPQGKAAKNVWMIQRAMESVDNEVNESELAGVISQSTGIPVNTMLGDTEKAKLLQMEAELGRSLVGQDEAISVISKCIRLSRAGLRYHDRPLGVFLMVGPTGVGKTELAKALSEFLFSDPNSSLLRVDMSEYMERFSVSRLIGAPPGYIGYEEGGVLTEAIRRRPYQVILLDEFEKAHRDVSNLLLQVFDEGRLSDSKGNAVDYRNTVILMTSNLGSDVLANVMNADSDGATEGADGVTVIDDAARQELLRKKKTEIATKLVHSHFSPEFVNRLDDVIVFNPLSEPAMLRICSLQLAKVTKLLADRDMTLHLSQEAVKLLAHKGTDLQYGARPMKRLIQNALLNPLATLILQEKIVPGNKILITTESESLADSSLVQQKVLSAEEAQRAAVISQDDDHSGVAIRVV